MDITKIYSKRISVLKCGVLILLSLACLIWLNIANAATVLQYHHVSESMPRETSVTPAEFKSHMQMLADSGRQVVSLQRLLALLRTNQPIPEDWTAITFDDGFRNIIEQADPVLKAHGFAYAIFVNPGTIDLNLPSMLDWEQLRKLKSEGVLIGNHSMSHHYLVREPYRGKKDAAIQDILAAQKRLEQEKVSTEKVFAYPYGEFDKGLMVQLEKYQFISFGQHSGAIGLNSHRQRLPRYPASGRYANTESVQQKLFTQAFDLDYDAIPDMVSKEELPMLTLLFKDIKFEKQQLRCFSGSEIIEDIVWLSEKKVSIRAKQPWSTARHRYNCTAPIPNQKQTRYYWFSQPWLSELKPPLKPE
jgi:poly-beta-1,6-N-acetyl-D-glucosamine N-deacetylase